MGSGLAGLVDSSEEWGPFVLLSEAEAEPPADCICTVHAPWLYTHPTFPTLSSHVRATLVNWGGIYQPAFTVTL